jgi:hypothetical protein
MCHLTFQRALGYIIVNLVYGSLTFGASFRLFWSGGSPHSKASDKDSEERGRLLSESSARLDSAEAKQRLLESMTTV